MSDDDPDESESETGATIELAVDDLNRLLPDQPADLREQLPGLEPERRVTDWGRSERIDGLVDRTVYDFLYHYWFRVEVEGIDNVPLDGGALLVANHAGAIASDGAMVAKAIREEHRRQRTVQLATESNLASYPGLGMLVTKLGAVASHPANLHRLLFDERQLVLVFPEGLPGARKALSQRYRLRPFDRCAFVATAIRARVPIVPVAILGAEEAMPTFASLKPLRKLAHLPLTTGVPLPAKFRIRFLEPVETEALGVGGVDIEDPAQVDQLQAEIRGLIQENLLELVAHRRSVWLG
jgi:1-acyl-sn-glycerol-3-phosphate acyltransferase